MSRFFYAEELTRPEDMIPRLAKQERDWKTGYSAYELARSWIDAGDIPASVRYVLDSYPTTRELNSLKACSNARWTCERPGVGARPTCSPSSSSSTATP